MDIALTPKQERVVNSLIGKVMRVCREKSMNFDPALIRATVIRKLEALLGEQK